MEANMFEFEGATYRVSTINARSQFHIVRRLAPVFGHVAPLVQGATDPAAVAKIGLDALPALADAIAGLSDADADYVLLGLLGAVSKKQPNGTGWSPVAVNGNIMFDDLTMVQMLRLAWEAFNHNMSGFFAASQSVLNAAPQKVSEQ